MRGSALALALLALLAFPAVADHVYTHRYVASGRVVDDEGVPVPNATVELQVDGKSSLDGECKSRPPEVRHDVLNITDENRTNSYGDFEACVHLHAVGPRSTARVRVDGGEWRALTVDRGTRLTFASVALDARPVDAPAPNPEWNRTLLVRARVWRPAEGALELDNVPALGEALSGRTVYTNVTGIGGRGKTPTDRYGDMAYYVRLSGPREGNVTFQTEDAPHALIPFAQDRLRAEAVLFVKAEDFAQGQTTVPDDAPERSATPVAGAFAFLAVACALAILGRSQK